MTSMTNMSMELGKISVAELALRYPQALEVFTRYHLDYCCGGKKPFNRACEESGLIAREIWNEIQAALPQTGTTSKMHFETWDINLLISFIEQHHHVYVRRAIPQLTDLLQKVCSVHGSEHPFLQSLMQNFSQLADELMLHLPKEEEILFPAMRRILGDQPLPGERQPMLNALQTPVMVMEDEHDRAGDLIKSIRVLTNYYSVPEWACATLTLTWSLLDQFDQDLVQHIHLENNILFPKVKGEHGTGVDLSLMAH